MLCSPSKWWFTESELKLYRPDDYHALYGPPRPSLEEIEKCISAWYGPPCPSLEEEIEKAEYNSLREQVKERLMSLPEARDDPKHVGYLLWLLDQARPGTLLYYAIFLCPLPLHRRNGESLANGGCDHDGPIKCCLTCNTAGAYYVTCDPGNDADFDYGGCNGSANTNMRACCPLRREDEVQYCPRPTSDEHKCKAAVINEFVSCCDELGVSVLLFDLGNVGSKAPGYKEKTVMEMLVPSSNLFGQVGKPSKNCIQGEHTVG